MENTEKNILKARKSKENIDETEANKENQDNQKYAKNTTNLDATNNEQVTTKNTSLYKDTDNIIAQLVGNTNDNEDFDPFTIATQKNSNSRNNSNLENDETDVAHLDIPFGNPTQKLNVNITKSFDENVEIDDNITHKVLEQQLGNNIKDFVRIIQNNSVEDMRKKLTFVMTHIKKLKDLTTQTEELGAAEVGVQTEQTVVDCAVQTCELQTSHVSIQTECEIMDRGVQTTLTENSYSNNSQQFLKENMKAEASGITQGTKKALESFLTEPEIVVSNTLKEGQNKSTTNTSTVLKLKTQNEVFSAGFDNFSFDTQDLAKQFLTGKKSGKKAEGAGDKLKDVSPKVSSSEDTSLQASKESKLVCTINSDLERKVNRKLVFNQKERTPKRNRNSTDSDTDEDIRPRRKKNRFIDSDLSVEFETNDKTIASPKKAGLTSDSENINYEECLNQILKNYDEYDTSPTKIQSNKSTINDRDKSTQNLLKRCDDIIAEVNRNVENLTKKMASKDDNEKPSTSRLDDDNNNVEEVKTLSGKSSRKSESQFSDVIGETESLGVLPKRFKLDTAPKKGKISTKPKGLVIKTPEKQVDTCGELNDSFDEEELEQISLVEKNIAEPTSRVNILANVKVQSGTIKEKCGTGNDNEDDLFSDDDVVETTPQKRTCLPESDPTNLLDKDDLDLSQQIEDFDLDLALPPPPAFQDDFGDSDDEKPPEMSSNQVTVVEHPSSRSRINLSSLTPDDLSQFIKKVSPKKAETSFLNRSVKQELIQTPEKSTRFTRNKFSHSTPHGSHINIETLGFSPIGNERNLIETAKSSKNNVLTVVPKETTPRQNLMTSTPKQKSIWNYLKTTQSNDNEEQLSKSTKGKPCLACTRLTNIQVMSITQLTNKKLATYSAIFNSGVTHMVVAVDERNCLVDYTVKFMAAVAAGIWVVRFEWVQECLTHNCIVPEEPFEVFDDSGGTGPKTARLMKNEKPLLRNFKFYCPELFVSTTRQEIEAIIKQLGGKVVSKPDYLQERDGRIRLILTEGRTTQDFDIYEKWLETYKTATVDIEWLSKSIGRYKILSIRPYIWCSDDNLAEFDYPNYLIEHVPFSDSEQQ